MIEVISVTHQDDYKLILNFNTGEVRFFDMYPYLEYTVFKSLIDIEIFKLAQVQYGTVTWPNEIDIAPERLYEESVNMADVD
jgi:hypothetical protein